MNIRVSGLLALGCLILPALAACSPLAAVVGAGTVTGVAAAQDGGLKGAASDLRIQTAISDLWFKYDLETFAKLHLTVEEGRVLITGLVQDPDDRVEAVRLAWQVKGVRQVINEIKISEGEGLKGYARDQWIATRLRTAITFDKEVQSINYSIDTVDGIVYLMGVAQDQMELDKVVETARTIPHVKQVVSYVKVRVNREDQGE